MASSPQPASLLTSPLSTKPGAKSPKFSKSTYVIIPLQKKKKNKKKGKKKKKENPTNTKNTVPRLLLRRPTLRQTPPTPKHRRKHSLHSQHNRAHQPPRLPHVRLQRLQRRHKNPLTSPLLRTRPSQHPSKFCKSGVYRDESNQRREREDDGGLWGVDAECSAVG